MFVLKGTTILFLLCLVCLTTVGIKLPFSEVFDNMGVKMCSLKCLNSGTCRGYAYNNETLTCRLLRRAGARTRGSTIVHRKHIHDVRNPCFLEQCRRGLSCVTTWRGALKCVRDFNICGVPPQIEDTTVQYTGTFWKAVATYTCEEDFKSCAEGTTSRCLLMGHWTFLRFLCVRFRWRAPIPPFVLSNPCRKQSTFDIKIIGKITHSTRMSISLKRGLDVLLYISYEFSGTGQHDDMIVFNTRVNEVWGTPRKRTASLITVNKTFCLRVTLSGGIYKVILDSREVMTLAERLPGVVPRFLQARHDVHLEVVEV